MNLEYEIPGDEHDCSYLPGMRATMTYRLAFNLPSDRYESLLERGWRRFGRTLFRPGCSGCAACQSLRVMVADFQPSKSQRRTLNRNRQIDIRIVKPGVSQEHLDLYNNYHLDMHQRRDWPFREISFEQYHESFLEGGFEFSREFQYRDNGRLVGLGLVDMPPNTMSSIYFFHHPDYRENALGTFSILQELAEARSTNRQWLYMGYYIRECQSMNYKNRFTPYQILQAYTDDQQPAHWVTQ